MKKLNVVCVDDEKISTDLMVHICSQIDEIGEVTGFTDSEKALDFIKNNTDIQVAFLDVDMPKYDGITLTGMIKEINPKINIIITTAYEEYALSAFREDCSGYLLKPISADEVRHQLNVLRYPLQDDSEKRIRAICFGTFEIFYNDIAVNFSYKKTKELFALLIDKRGAICSNADIQCALWEDDDHPEYVKKIKRDLVSTVAELTDKNIFTVKRNVISLNCKEIDCDYFDYLESKNNVTFKGEYMEQYSWAEERKGLLFSEV